MPSETTESAEAREVLIERCDVVIFDGMCNLCARCVRFILAHEADHSLRFTPGQSPAGARLMRELGLDPEDARTFVLISNGKAYVKSEAAVRVAGHLRGPERRGIVASALKR